MLFRIAPIWQRLKMPHPSRFPSLFHVHPIDGDEAAEHTAATIGSWWFIIGEVIVMAAWVTVNTLAAFAVIRYDPYPYVLLNLAMSAESALTGPILLIAANVSAIRDHKMFMQMQQNQKEMLAELALMRQELAEQRQENAAQREQNEQMQAGMLAMAEQLADVHDILAKLVEQKTKTRKSGTVAGTTKLKAQAV